MVGPAEYLGQWQGGWPVDTWSAGGGWDYRTSAEKEDGQGRLDLGIHLRNGHTAADGCREQKMCQVRPQPGQLAEALLKHTLAR